jgi:hypothetical protein
MLILHDQPHHAGETDFLHGEIWCMRINDLCIMDAAYGNLI